jgi:dsDNA-specific endonuclease/ATPase MutS2
MTDNSSAPFRRNAASNDSTAHDPDFDDPADREPVHLPITDVFDLHTVSPRDAHAVVEEYLHECYRLGLTAIRIIHGRGIGAQRAMVRKVLERMEFVVSFRDAPAEAGGWGATVITLRKKPSC